MTTTTATETDLDAELAQIEQRRRELREAKQQRITALRGQLARLQERLRSLAHAGSSIDNPHTRPEVQQAHHAFFVACCACENFVGFLDLPHDQRYKGRDSRGQPIPNESLYAAKQKELAALNAAALAAQDAYRSAVVAAALEMQAAAGAAKKKAAIEAAELRQQIAAIEAELLRMEPRS